MYPASFPCTIIQKIIVISLNYAPINNKKEKQKQQEEDIQKRAEELARKIVEEKNNNNSLDGNPEEQKVYEQFFKETFRSFIDENQESENQEIVQVRSLASLGLIVSSFSHELKEVSNNISEIDSLEKIYSSLIPKENKLTSYYEDVVDIFELLKGDKEKIKFWVDYTLTAIRKDKRTRSKLDINTFFRQLKEIWKRIFKRKDVELIIVDKIEGNQYDFRAFEMDMTTIFSNLINNSIDSFEQRKSIEDRTIIIEYQIIDKNIEILYSDNGKGLDKAFANKEDILLAFTTSKRDRKGNEIGTGLGMYLVKSVIDDNNGNIEILEPSIGFSVKITFPIIK